MTSLPETVEVEPSADPVGSVVWLHGLGADGHDFEALVPELRLPATLPLRFVFPHAPVRPVTINGGMAMRAWYDIASLDKDGPQDEQGIRESARLLEALIAREQERGLDASQIAVAGFSQGGAIAMHMAIRHEQRLAGLLALSTWLPLASSLPVEVQQNTASQPRDLPVFLAHGTFDPMLPLALGQEAGERLRALGFTVEWHEYPMQHAVCPEEIADIRAWLIDVFS